MCMLCSFRIVRIQWKGFSGSAEVRIGVIRWRSSRSKLEPFINRPSFLRQGGFDSPHRVFVDLLSRPP